MESQSGQDGQSSPKEATKKSGGPCIVAAIIVGTIVVFLAAIAAVGVIWLARSRAAYQNYRNPNNAQLAKTLSESLTGSTYALISTDHDSSGASETYKFTLAQGTSIAELSDIITSWSARGNGNRPEFICQVGRAGGAASDPCGWEVGDRRFARATWTAFVEPVPRTDGHDPSLRVTELSVQIHSFE
jgi:hypothetical protein